MCAPDIHNIKIISQNSNAIVQMMFYFHCGILCNYKKKDNNTENCFPFKEIFVAK